MEIKTSWWYLKIDDYPNYKPNDRTYSRMH
jgi:hypothetical protein